MSDQEMQQEKKVIMTGAEAAAFAMKQINPDVVPAYPITPQTEIMHNYTQFVADGVVDTEMILVESEHSAMSAAVGASAAGSRVMTATAANGLALMHEIVYIAASGRLPIVMNIVNRALSGPINIHCDHSDSMAERDSGWLQIYSETAQEVYDNTILAMKIAENPDVSLPMMVCQDGFITSHCEENLEIIEKREVQNYLGEHKAVHPLLDVENPKSFGPLDLQDYYFEHKKQQVDAMKNALHVFKDAAVELEKITGRSIPYYEKYMLDDADFVIVVMSSTAGLVKDRIDLLRGQGLKVGLLKIKLFRPFPFEDIAHELKDKKAIAVMDRSDSFGAFGGPLHHEIKSALYGMSSSKIKGYVFGLGGRDITADLIDTVYHEIIEGERHNDNDFFRVVDYLGVRE